MDSTSNFSTTAKFELAIKQKKYEELKEKLHNLEKTTSTFNSSKQKEEVMQLMHHYNDIKDATQVVLGKLSNLEGVTLKEIHLKYNLPLDLE